LLDKRKEELGVVKGRGGSYTGKLGKGIIVAFEAVDED
jgi:hypothetical protein